MSRYLFVSMYDVVFRPLNRRVVRVGGYLLVQFSYFTALVQSLVVVALYHVHEVSSFIIAVETVVLFDREDVNFVSDMIHVYISKISLNLYMSVILKCQREPDNSVFIS